MANDLTGQFDIVAEFSIPTVNRILAAMHQAERFLHSIAIYVNDRRKPVHPTKGDSFSILGSVDTFGDPTVDHTKIGTLVPVSGQLPATDPIFRVLDPVVNPELIGATVGPIVPSNLKGVAQLQLSPPTIDVADASGSNITVGMHVMARYLPDPNTIPLAEFVRGQLQITAPVSQVASQSGNVIDVNLKAGNVKIKFSPDWSSGPLSNADLDRINLLILNALKTSFLPSTNQMPPDADYVQFKVLLGNPNNPNGIGLMLNMASYDPVTHRYEDPGEPGDPASMNKNFLGLEDDFALAMGRDFLLASFASLLKLGDPTRTTNYTITISKVGLDLGTGEIVVTTEGSAIGNKRRTINFKFTVKLRFKLQANGDTVDLVPEDISEDDVDTDSWVVNNFAKGVVVDNVQQARDRALKKKDPNDPNSRDVYGQVNDMLSADKNLGQFLKPLLKAPPRPGTLPPQDVLIFLWYNSVDITRSGVVLKGSLAAGVSPPHVEFEQIAATTGRHHIVTGPNYSALKSWIPGGSIQRYEWSRGQAPPFTIDENTFVLIQMQLPSHSLDVVSGEMASQPVSVDTATHPAVVGFTPLCLTVRGTRLSVSRPFGDQSVSATICEYSSFPSFPLTSLSTTLSRELPLVALTQPGPGGLVQVTGYASARPDGDGGPSPNMIVHFADEQTAGHLDLLTQALLESRREDAPTAVLAVLTTNQLANARHTEGVIYTEEQGGVWERIFKVKLARRPLTLIVGPKGHALWHHEGELDSKTLAAALHRVLVKSEPIKPGMLRLSLRIGHPAPNFLFESAPGQQLTLRKLEGRPVELVFWKSSSTPSIETVRDRQERARKAGAQGPVVLAINDGEAPELAKGFAAENKLSATIVADPERNITRAYGVNIWPTTVFIDAFGLVRQIHYGRFAGEHLAYPSREKGAAAR